MEVTDIVESKFRTTVVVFPAVIEARNIFVIGVVATDLVVGSRGVPNWKWFVGTKVAWNGIEARNIFIIVCTAIGDSSVVGSRVVDPIWKPESIKSKEKEECFMVQAKELVHSLRVEAH